MRLFRNYHTMGPALPWSRIEESAAEHSTGQDARTKFADERGFAPVRLFGSAHYQKGARGCRPYLPRIASNTLGPNRIDASSRPGPSAMSPRMRRMTLPDRVFGSSEVRKFGDDGDLPGFGDGSNVGGHLSLEFGDQDVAGVFDTFRHDSNPAGIIRRRASYERSSSWTVIESRSNARCRQEESGSEQITELDPQCGYRSAMTLQRSASVRRVTPISRLMRSCP